MDRTETHHEPTPDELAHEATDRDHHDEHAHAGEVLGPVDVQAWGALAIGVAAGLLIVLCLVIATSLV
jgi:hypothetical protein